MIYKCISLWNPWACLIPIGAKKYETRSWPTKYRGPILIHAAQKWNNDLRRTLMTEAFKAALKPNYPTMVLPFGAIVGVADLDMCWQTSGGKIWRLTYWEDVPYPEAQFGNFGFGRYAWELKNPRRFETPIPFRGMQGIFNVPDAVVAEQLAKARAA